MTRMTEERANSIAHEILAHRFEAEARELLDSHLATANKCLDHVLGDLVPVLDGLREGVVPESSSTRFSSPRGEVYEMRVGVPGGTLGYHLALDWRWLAERAMRREPALVRTARRVPFELYNGRVAILDDAHWEMVMEQRDRERAFGHRVNTAHASVRGALKTMKTLEGAREQWPEAAAFIEPLIERAGKRTQAVSVRLGELNELLGLPPGETTDG